MQVSDKAAHCGFSNIWLIKYERITIVDKLGKESTSLTTKAFQTFTWIVIFKIKRQPGKNEFENGDVILSDNSKTPPWSESY